MKFKYLIIFITIGLLFALYVLSLFTHPVLISFSDIPAYTDQQVIIQGIVTDYRTTAYGSQLITIADTLNHTNSVLLYVEGEAPIEYGDMIQATGEVQQYKNQWEIVVNNPHFIIVLQKWDYLVFPLWELALHPDSYLNTNVNVTGIVTAPSGSSFLLASTDGKYSIEVIYQSSCPHQFSKDDTVTVKARFLYDAATCRFLLSVTQSTHGIWRSAG
jgi:hypothetical protein